MSQIFHRSTNTLSRVTIYAAVFLAAGLLFVVAALDRSPYNTRQGIVLKQPVPFSHEHHVRGLGIDCRYCHGSVEESAYAGMPTAGTCMNCHRLIWSDSPMLEPVRRSAKTGEAIAWARVHDLPDFVYFNHSIHVAKGIGCVSCHGQVDQMPLMRQANRLQMEWCLGCHRHPEQNVRPREEVFSQTWQAGDQAQLGPQLVRAYHIRGARDLTSCSVCHR